MFLPVIKEKQCYVKKKRWVYKYWSHRWLRYFIECILSMQETCNFKHEIEHRF